MKEQKETITYEVYITRTGEAPFVQHRNEGKLGVFDFKAMAEEERELNPDSKIECFRLVDGEMDGKGVIMRYTQKGGGVALPNGTYREVDNNGFEEKKYEDQRKVVTVDSFYEEF